MTAPLFDRVTIIGFGHIGSSLARAIRARAGIVGRIVACDRDPSVLEAVTELALADEVCADLSVAVAAADLIVLAVPISGLAPIGKEIATALKPGAIVTDVGSVKQAVLRDLGKMLSKANPFVPGHPIAGLENSGPRSGRAKLFEGRWTILTPTPETDRAAVEKIASLWAGVGSQVTEMSAEHHDKVLAITSHLPHLIAFTMVGTAVDLEESLQSEVVKFSAGGFRDMTRIAASDPTMWRDIFLNNRDAVLEMIQRLSEDLSALQRAIRWGDGELLFDRFTRAREIRRGVIAAKQA